MTVLHITDFCSYAVLSDHSEDADSDERFFPRGYTLRVVEVMARKSEAKWPTVEKFRGRTWHYARAVSYADELEREQE